MKSVIKTMKNRIKDTIYYPRTLVEAIVSLKENKSLQNILDDKIDKNKIAYDLTTTNTDMVLGADQGPVIAQQIDSLNNNLKWTKDSIVSGDLNNYTQVGVYTYNGWDSSLLNKPVSGRWGTLTVAHYGVNTCQTLTDENGVTYSRRAYDTGWTNWTDNLTVSLFEITAASNCRVNNNRNQRIGRLVILNFSMLVSTSTTGWVTIANIPQGYRPNVAGETICVQDSSNNFYTLFYNVNGELNIYTTTILSNVNLVATVPYLVQ